MPPALARALAALAVLALACGQADAPPASRPLADAELPALYAALEGQDADAIRAALARILEAGDRRFVSVLIEDVRMSHLAGARSAAYNDRVVALERLSGQLFGGDWFRYAEWYPGSGLSAPPGFRDYKGRLYGQINPELGGFLNDGLPSRLHPEEIRWGGVLPGAIPALTNPRLESAASADWLVDDEPVFGVAVGGEARAYPLRILDWHEIVNDRLGGRPLTVSSCVLGGSVIAWDTGQPEGAHAFETSGLLYRSNKLMFDTSTRTLWSQLTGRALHGPLAAGENRLEALPGVVTRWSAWRARHPESSVLSLDTGHERAYEPGQPYGSYQASAKTLYPVSVDDARLPRKARVYGVARGGASRAIPLEPLLRERVRNETLGNAPLVLVAPDRPLEIAADVPGVGNLRYEVGAAVRAYDGAAGPFATADAPDTLLDDAGRSWRVSEEALHGPDGARAARVPGTLAYWFAWRAFHPETEISP